MADNNSLSTPHPAYTERVREWEQCRDCWRGEYWVKQRDGGVRYLPPTQGMVRDGLYAHPSSNSLNKSSLGYSAYSAYLVRAVLHSFFRDAVQMLMGLMWNKKASYKLKGIEFIEKAATSRGESLEQLHMRINEQQLAVGRLGLLTDLSDKATIAQPKPYISLYEAETIINWDGGFRGEIPVEVLNLVVLNESGYKRKTFDWDWHEQYRVLMLGDLESNDVAGIYRQGVFMTQENQGPTFDETLLKPPGARGQTLNEIPFVFCNAQSTITQVEDPPLLGLSDLVLALYRLEADYRQELHASTQATLWTKGIMNLDPSKPMRVGAGGHIDLGTNPEAECGYLELSGRGLPEMRHAVTKDKELAKTKSGEMVDQSSRARESGDAMSQRIGTKTATLNQVAISGAEALTRSLRYVAMLSGVKNLNDIEVIPNFDFASKDWDAASYLALVQAKMTHGAPISLESMHQYAVDQGYTTTQFDEMMRQIEKESEFLKKLQPEIPVDPNKKMAVDAQLKKAAEGGGTAAKSGSGAVPSKQGGSK
jgi:hypothetical protein